MVPDVGARADDNLCGVAIFEGLPDLTADPRTRSLQMVSGVSFSCLVGYSPPVSLGQEHGDRYV